MEQSPHRATDDFGVPEVNGSGQTDDGGGTEGGRGPYDRPNVARVLYRVENDEPKRLIDPNGVEAVFRNFSDDEYSLRRIRIGRRREFGGGDLMYRHAALTKGRKDGLGLGEIESGRCEEGAANDERRTKKLVDSSNAFGNEETLALARVAALQVTGYAEHTHATGT